MRSSIVYVTCRPARNDFNNWRKARKVNQTKFQATSPEYSTSYESSSEEATADNSATTSSLGKGKSSKKKDCSKTTKITRPEAKKRRKQETAMLDRKEMEHLLLGFLASSKQTVLKNEYD